MQRNDVKPRAEVLARDHGLARARAQASSSLGGLGFENAYALAMPRAARARRWASARSPISRATRRTFRSPATTNSSAGRNGTAIRKAYGLTFREQRRCSRSSCIRRRQAGEVDVIAGYTSDGRIAQHDLVVLDDPKHAIPPYDAMLLVSPKRANDRACSMRCGR